jgi:hypothetical protein
MYRKALKLSQKSKQEFNQGQIINIMSNDTSKIANFTNWVHYLWRVPLTLISIIYHKLKKKR